MDPMKDHPPFDSLSCTTVDTITIFVSDIFKIYS